jgi:hypothetical protein
LAEGGRRHVCLAAGAACSGDVMVHDVCNEL